MVSRKAEFGPRALGNRSILGNPLLNSMQKINLKVQYRESFRPAPVILEKTSEWFDINTESPVCIVSSIAKGKLLENHNMKNTT